MNIDDFCKFLGIAKPTIYNWKKEKPNLYKIVMSYKENKFNNETKEDNELVQLLNLLNTKEKEMYIHEIKARILRKELDK